MKDNKLFLILKIAVLVIVISCTMNCKKHDDGFDLVIKKIESEKYFGITERKFIDSENHNSPTIILNTGKRITLYGEFWDKIDIGDSLSKDINTTVIKVFKKNEIIQVDEKEYILHLKEKNK